MCPVCNRGYLYDSFIDGNTHCTICSFKERNKGQKRKSLIGIKNDKHIKTTIKS